LINHLAATGDFGKLSISTILVQILIAGIPTGSSPGSRG
jgi:hypothetical protein